MLPTNRYPVPRTRSRGPAPLLVILGLLAYIVRLKWSASGSSGGGGHGGGYGHARNIAMSTDKTGWSHSNGTLGASIYQRPLSPVPAGAPRIGIATMNTDETTYDHISLANKFGYADKHNYAIKLDLEVPQGLKPLAVWHKLNMIEYLVRTGDYDWIWWVDYDTVITNTSVKLEDIIAESLASAKNPAQTDLILTADCWPLNAGSMLIRSSPRMLDFLSLVWACGDTPKEPSEQDCMLSVLQNNKEWMARAIWVPQTKLNAFPDEISCWDKHQTGWKPGDFVVHFAGAWAHLKGKAKKDPYGVLMRKYGEWIDKTKLTGMEDYQVLGEGPKVEEPEIVATSNGKMVVLGAEEPGSGEKD